MSLTCSVHAKHNGSYFRWIPNTSFSFEIWYSTIKPNLEPQNVNVSRLVFQLSLPTKVPLHLRFDDSHELGLW